MAKSLSNRFPLRKLNRKRDFKRRGRAKNPSARARRAGRGQGGISRRDAT